MELYNRAAELNVINKKDSTVRVVKGLRIIFEIEKTSEPTPNTASITVFNLNQENRDFLKSEDLRVVLLAGYTGQERSGRLVSSVFSGDVKKVATEKSGPDFLTTLECGDSEKSIQETHFEKTYSAEDGTHVLVIIKELAAALGLVVNDENIKGVSDNKFINPVILSGNVKKHLDDLVSKEGLEWSVQDGEIHIRNRTDAKFVNAFLLNVNTGLIGTPVKREKGIEFLSLLNPLIRPTETVKIESRFTGSSFVNGSFVVKRAYYKGDTHEGEWVVRGEALEGVDT
mgnify:CR=1 FL=1